VTGPFFHEFALSLPVDDVEFARAMRARGVDPGVPLSRFGRPGALLVAVTELNPPEALDRYVAAAREILDANQESGQGRGSTLGCPGTSAQGRA